MATTAAPRARWSMVGLLLVMGAAFGLEFSMLKLAAEGGYPGVGILLVALVIIAAVFCTIVVLRRRRFRPSWRLAVFFFVVAMLGYVLPLLAALTAAPHLPAGMLTLITAFTPLVSVATALLARTEPVSARRLVAVALGLAAALVVLLPEAGRPDAGDLPWLLLVFVVPLTYGVESVYVAQNWPQGIDPWHVCAGQSLFGALAMVPIQLVFGEPIPFDPSWPMAQVAILIVAACVLLEVLLFFVIIKETGGVLVSFGMYVSLFAGIAWGAVIFGERLGLAAWIGIAVLAVALAFTVPRSGDRGVA